MVLEISLFSCLYAILSNGPWRQFLMVNLHKSEIDPFKTHFFFIRKHSGTKLNQFQPMVFMVF